MANTKITNLPLLTAVAADEIPVSRVGTDGKVTAGDIAALAPGSGNNILIDDDHGIYAAGGPKQLIFQNDAAAVNWLEVYNRGASTFGSIEPYPGIRSAGAGASVGMAFQVKGAVITPFTFEMGSGTSADFFLRGTTDSATGIELVGYQDSASPAANDFPFGISFAGNDSAGSGSYQDYALIWGEILDTTAGAEYGRLVIYATVNGNEFREHLLIDNDGVKPGQSNTTTLGDTNEQWADLFLGSGAVINFNAGDVTLTHSANRLAIAGGTTAVDNLAVADATGILDENGNEQLIFQTTASAENHFEVTNAADGNYPIFAAAGDDTNVGMRFNVKGAPGDEAVKFNLGSAASADFTIEGTSTSVFQPTLTLYHNSVSAANADGLGRISFVGKNSAGDKGGFAYIRAYAKDINAATKSGGMEFSCYTNLSDDIEMVIVDGVILGYGGFAFHPGPGNGNLAFIDDHGLYVTDGVTFPPEYVKAVHLQFVTGAVNYLDVTPGATTDGPILAAKGSDTDIDLTLQPKGAGVVQYGTHSAIAGETTTGYITIRDAGGTLRKLAVVS